MNLLKGPFIYYVITFLGFLQHVFSTKNKQKLAFSEPLPPTSADVIYEWSLLKMRLHMGIGLFVGQPKLSTLFCLAYVT